MQANQNTYDYIIIGAGSAGCVLANRLSDNQNNSVLLIEAGGSDKNIFIKMPTALSIPMNTKRFNWGYHSLPEPYINNRIMHCPRGKGFGGSSSINGMVYVRGHACDFEQWQHSGAEGWGYQDCLPYFKKAEHWMHGGDEYRGDKGPIGVCTGNDMRLNPLYEVFIKAGEQAGYQRSSDYNGYRQEGFAPMQMTVNDGVRSSTSREYLDPVKHRKNLHIISHALTEKILIQNKQAQGVIIRHGGKTKTFHSNKEVILSAGAVGSPQLLQLSGIGPADILKNAAIEVQHDLPGVGQNVQDHLEVYFQYRCKQPISLNAKLNVFSKFMIGSRWLLSRSGLGATNHFESCAFIRSRAGIKWPNIQYHFLPAAIRYDGKRAFDGHGFQVHVGPNKPHSRGYIQIKSPHSQDHPDIRFNYLQHEQDRLDWRDCIRLTREIMQQPVMDAYRDSAISPSEDIQSDDEIDAWVRENVESAYHVSCSCKMGAKNDVNAVVDANCRVYGIDNLRVVDSSIFPVITNGNLNAPTIMVAEKAADLILGHTPLSPQNTPFYIHPNWRQCQR